MAKGKDRGWVLGLGRSPSMCRGETFSSPALGGGRCCGLDSRALEQGASISRAQQPVRMRPAVRGLCSACFPSVQSQLYKRINPVNNFSLPGALPALVSCSRSISWALRAGSSRGSGDDISMEACGADPPEHGERRASAS